MRLVLTVRGVDVVDIELRWPSTATGAEPPALEASGGGQVERAEPYGDPATQVTLGFGGRHGTQA